MARMWRKHAATDAEYPEHHRCRMLEVLWPGSHITGYGKMKGTQ